MVSISCKKHKNKDLIQSILKLQIYSQSSRAINVIQHCLLSIRGNWGFDYLTTRLRDLSSTIISLDTEKHDLFHCFPCLLPLTVLSSVPYSFSSLSPLPYYNQIWRKQSWKKTESFCCYPSEDTQVEQRLRLTAWTLQCNSD